MTEPVTTPSSSLMRSMVPQARSYCAGFDLVADGDDLVGVDVVLDGQLASEDDAFGLVADVEEDLITVDLDDSALDDIAVIEVLDGLVNGGEDLLGRTDVVDGDRGGAGRSGCH